MSTSPTPSLASLPSITSSSSSSAFSSPSSSHSDLPPVPLPHISKREYLLAQIRQKDAIIESLLKQVGIVTVLLLVRGNEALSHPQVHNPYIATPMSIASYKMAISPSDSSNKNVLAWLGCLEASVQNAGAKAGPRAFKDLRAHAIAADDDDSDDDQNRAQPFGLEPSADDDGRTIGDEEGTARADDKLSSLPDSHVPLGLIANLSLSNHKAKNGKKEPKDVVAAEENLDDDDIVCITPICR